jgi:hypothetical protein
MELKLYIFNIASLLYSLYYLQVDSYIIAL